MSMSLRNRVFLALGASGILALAAPALAAPDDAGKDVPTCSATVTDHCMQRGGGGHHAGMGKHHMGKHKMTSRHGGKHHRGGRGKAHHDKPAAKPKS